MLPDTTGHFGRFGGRFVPEALIAALDELDAEYTKAQDDPEFRAELSRLLDDYAGRPSRLYDATRFSEAAGARVLRVHVDAVRAAVELRDAQPQQLAVLVVRHPEHGVARRLGEVLAGLLDLDDGIRPLAPQLHDL